MYLQLESAKVNNSQMLTEVFGLQQFDKIKHYVSVGVKCVGFAEYDPQNFEDFLGYFRFLADVFNNMKVEIDKVAMGEFGGSFNFVITGEHHEEFLGLAATGGDLHFSGSCLVHFKHRKISKIIMYKKSVVLTTASGSHFLSLEQC